MQNCNLAGSLQFLRLDTHLTTVKCDCNRFDVVTVVNLIKIWTQRVTSTRTTITNNEKAKRSLFHCLNCRNMKNSLDQFYLIA